MERIKNLFLCDWPLRSNEELTMVVNADGRMVFNWVTTNMDGRLGYFEKTLFFLEKSPSLYRVLKQQGAIFAA